jgi:hypothetical protein
MGQEESEVFIEGSDLPSPDAGTAAPSDPPPGDPAPSATPAAAAEGDPAPDVDPKKPRVEFTPEQQEVYDDSLRKKTAKTAEARADADRERQGREAAEARLAQLETPLRPELPAEPNYLDDDYEDQTAAYNTALRAQATFDAEADVANRNNQRAQWEEGQRRQVQQQETITKYAERTETLGVDKVVMSQAGPAVAAAIAAYAVPNQPSALLDYILGDEHGPLITEYLYKNPEQLNQVASMSDIQAGEFMSSVKAKAIAARPKKTPGPAPLDNPDGIGLGEPSEDDKWGTYS